MKIPQILTLIHFIVIQASSLDILSLISNITVKKSQATKRKQKKEILK